ncbi:MAG: DNA-binding protein [Bacteroidia bacterium]|nr:DNA-binding protein [Bacteroidia bacterium]
MRNGTNNYSLSLFIFFILFISCNNPISVQNESVRHHAFRLLPGMDLKKEIEKFVHLEDINAGWIVTCVGSLTQTNLRYANQSDGSQNNGHFEIVSLVGTLSKDGCHLHLSISDSLGQTKGGHLLEGNLVYTTAELVIAESHDLIFTREKDGSTEWKELQVKKKY